MPGSAAKVVISERQQEVLRQLSTATSVAKRLTQRAAIVLLAFAGLDNEAIAPRVGLERHQVGRAVPAGRVHRAVWDPDGPCGPLRRGGSARGCTGPRWARCSRRDSRNS